MIGGRGTIWVLAVCALLWPALAAQAAHAPFRQRYVLFFANLNTTSDQDRLRDVMRRAAAVGYNGIVLGDNGGQYLHLATQPPAFFASFARVR